jgi:hypothetical protein
MDIVYAIFLGGSFGFVLQRVGAADPEQIIDMLTLKELRLAKAILAGIGIASVLVFSSIYIGIVDPGHLSVKSMYWGVPIGGLILGFGWALTGYCPGTGVVAAGTGRKDALFFILGGLFGAGIFARMFEGLKDSFLMTEVFGGKISVVATPSSTGIIDAPWSPLVAVVIGAALILLAKVVPDRLS